MLIRFVSPSPTITYKIVSHPAVIKIYLKCLLSSASVAGFNSTFNVVTLKMVVVYIYHQSDDT